MLVLVLLVGAVGYHALGYGVLDSFYMSVIFLTTTGARDAGLLGWKTVVWSIFVILVGATVGLVAFSNLLAMVTGGELRKIIGRRKLETKIQSMAGHHVICGYGQIGMPVCEELHDKKVPFVVVDNDPAKASVLDARGYLHILGDATEEEVLIHAGIRNAKGLVTALASDADNVYVTLTARGLNGKLQIVAVSEGKGTETKLMRAGADRVINPHQIGATRITNLLLRPAIVEFSDVATRGVELEIGEVEISSDSPVAGKLLRDSQLREKSGAMVVAIKRSDGTTIFAPTAEMVLKPGDTLITIRKSDGLPTT